MSRKNCIVILIFVKSFNSFATKVRRNFGEDIKLRQARMKVLKQQCMQRKV